MITALRRDRLHDTDDDYRDPNAWWPVWFRLDETYLDHAGTPEGDRIRTLSLKAARIGHANDGDCRCCGHAWCTCKGSLCDGCGRCGACCPCEKRSLETRPCGSKCSR